jgi:hypothetical protein
MTIDRVWITPDQVALRLAGGSITEGKIGRSRYRRVKNRKKLVTAATEPVWETCGGARTPVHD